MSEVLPKSEFESQENSAADADVEIKRAAQLSITEVGLGSIGHGFKIPLTGQILSLNQLGFLLNAVNTENLPKASTFEISSIAAILKSFSPAGKKLGPMLSIAMQGFLFWISIAVIGSNLIGQIIGAILLSLWAFVQPLVGLFFIYGLDLVKLSEFYIEKINDDYSFIATALIYAILIVFALKIILSIIFVVFSLKFKKEIKFIDESKVKLNILPVDSAKMHPLKGAVKDLFRPLFLLSFVLMMIFVWQLNGNLSEKIWLSLRPLATAFIIFYLLRSPWVSKKLFDWSQRSERFNKVYKKTLKAREILLRANK